MFFDSPNITIYGYKGSTAETYAKDNSYAFVALTSHGDADGDGSITVTDAANLSRYLAGWDGYGDDSVNVYAHDLNGDGRLNNVDSAILDRHLAVWSGYETIPLA